MVAGSTPHQRSKISLKKNLKEDFRTRPPLLDRRVGLVGELFTLLFYPTQCLLYAIPGSVILFKPTGTIYYILGSFMASHV